MTPESKKSQKFLPCDKRSINQSSLDFTCAAKETNKAKKVS